MSSTQFSAVPRRETAQPIAFSVDSSCRYTGLSRSTLYKLARNGQLQMIRVAGRTLIRRAELDRLITEASTSVYGE
ncbi:MAG: helix-turn-helix domain-containing protein [Maritimibacter sp.]|nr:helix-turn-helix domain-containing protein [Maritimibacter sp.]